MMGRLSHPKHQAPSPTHRISPRPTTRTPRGGRPGGPPPPSAGTSSGQTRTPPPPRTHGPRTLAPEAAASAVAAAFRACGAAGSGKGAASVGARREARAPQSGRRSRSRGGGGCGRGGGGGGGGPAACGRCVSGFGFDDTSILALHALPRRGRRHDARQSLLEPGEGGSAGRLRQTTTWRRRAFASSGLCVCLRCGPVRRGWVSECAREGSNDRTI